MQKALFEGKEGKLRNFLDIAARRRTWLGTSQKSLLWLGASELLPGCKLSEVHAGTWLAEQTDTRSLHQVGLGAISGLAKGPEEQQGGPVSP